MRIRLHNQNRFFREILENKKISLKQLSINLKKPYSSLKKYRRGELTIPARIFNDLINDSIRKDYWISRAKKFGNNWGKIRGGKISAKRNNIKKRMEDIRKFRKIKEARIRLNEFFCEFYGLMLGDGCISRFKVENNREKVVISISGNKLLDSIYLKNIKRKIEKELGIYSYYYEYKNKNVCVLSIRNKKLAIELNSKFKIPIGLKYKDLRLSKKILKLPWNLKKYAIRGLFDSDGSIYAKKSEDYRYPIISIRSKNVSFLKEILNLLRDHSYPAYVSKWNVSVRGVKNIQRWFGDIGSSNPRNLLKYKYFINHKRLPPKVV